MKDVVIGIDFGGTTIKFGIVTKTGKILKKWVVSTPINSKPNKIIDLLSLQVKQATKGVYNLLGVGIGIPGSVRPDTLRVYDCNNLGWYGDVDIVNPLSKNLDIPVIIENDANAAAVGEQWKGSLRRADILYVTLGTGVGSGIIINNQLIHGATGAAGELGHVIVNPNGKKCTCGNRGCLETVSSATGIVNTYKAKTRDHVHQVTAKIVFDQAKRNAPIAVGVIDDACDYLGLAIANVINLLNLQEVIIGGGVSAAGEYLRLRVEKAMNKYLYSSNQGITEVKLAVLGNDAGILGVAKLILDRIVSLPL